MKGYQRKSGSVSVHASMITRNMMHNMGSLFFRLSLGLRTCAGHGFLNLDDYLKDWCCIPPVVVSGVLDNGCPATPLFGTLYGRVTTDSSHPAWLGAKIGDSIDAEIQAATIATLFFLAHAEMFCDGPVFLCPDLLYSEGLINGVFSPHQTRTATAVLSQIGSIAAGCGLGLLHAKAHRGWEWNELVDALAKYATSLETAGIPPEVTFVAQMAKNHDGRCGWSGL